MEFRKLSDFTRDLEYGDIVYLFGLKYKVESNYLHGIGDMNSLPFNEVGIGKNDFARMFYGYDTDLGDWPFSETDDYAALTRLVKALMLIEESQKKPIDIVVTVNGKEVDLSTISKETWEKLRG